MRDWAARRKAALAEGGEADDVRRPASVEKPGRNPSHLFAKSAKATKPKTPKRPAGVPPPTSGVPRIKSGAALAGEPAEPVRPAPTIRVPVPAAEPAEVARIEPEIVYVDRRVVVRLRVEVEIVGE